MRNGQTIMSDCKRCSASECAKLIAITISLCLVLGGAGLFLLRGGVDPAYHTRAGADIENIRFVLNETMKRGKTSPSGITEKATPVRDLLTEIPAENLKDPWGHDYLIQRLPATTGELTFRIYSLGKDGVVSSDDVDDFP